MDDEWEAMARRAGADRDRAVRDTRAPDRFRLDEDITREMGRLAPLLEPTSARWPAAQLRVSNEPLPAREDGTPERRAEAKRHNRGIDRVRS